MPRPTRKTKEAATIFMEMLGKDLRSPDDEDNIDSMSVESFVELPNSKQQGMCIVFVCDCQFQDNTIYALLPLHKQMLALPSTLTHTGRVGLFTNALMF